MIYKCNFGHVDHGNVTSETETFSIDLLSFILSYRNNKDLVCTKCKEDQSVESDTSVLTLDQVIKHISIYLYICLSILYLSISNMLMFTFCI